MKLSKIYGEKIRIAALCCIVAFSIAGCGDSQSDAGYDTGDAELDAALEAVEEYNPEDFVELGTYKGVEVNVYVSDDDVDGEIMNLLSQNTEVEQIKKGKVKDGDTVNINFVGKMDGVEFPNGSSDDYSLTIGSNSFIDGFESGLIGMKVGDTTTLHLNFPDPYPNNPDYAGKAVDFDVTINYINGKANVPEYNDDFVKEYTKGEYTSADEYKKVLKQQLVDNKRDSAGDTAFNTVLNTSKVTDVPDYLVNIMKLRLDASYKSMAKSNGSDDFDKYLTDNWNMTKEQYEEQLESTARNYAEQKLIAEAIAKKENIDITDDEYQENLEQYMKNMNIDSEEDFEKYVVANFRSRAEDIIEEAVITDKVITFVKDNAVEVDTPAEDTADDNTSSNTDKTDEKPEE